MSIHILGVCGTFMGGVAGLAKALGRQVSGSDANVYPPMSTQLELLGVELRQGYSAGNLVPAPDLVIIGNALSRGNPAVEYVLNEGIPYTSGPQWLAEQVLPGRTVLAVAGTHGKTTTTALLAWILESAGHEPGFLVGGVPENFGTSARLGTGRPFVVEADEYDTAFFDKRSKFVHYRPKILVINNIEFDHADIFGDIAAIRRQFHQLIRTVPGTGRIITKSGDAEISRVLDMGNWSHLESFGADEADWQARSMEADYSAFEVRHAGRKVGEIRWSLIGRHNAENALAAVASAVAVGVGPSEACVAAGEFKGVKRRLQRLADAGKVAVYDDFAHHPTAIRATLEALRQHVGDARIGVILEPRSNTMKLGVHSHELAPALELSDRVFMYRPSGLGWDPEFCLRSLGERSVVSDNIDDMVTRVVAWAKPGDNLVIMSNGGFGDMGRRLLESLGG